MDVPTVPLYILLPILLAFVSKGAGDNTNDKQNSKAEEKITNTAAASAHV